MTKRSCKQARFADGEGHSLRRSARHEFDCVQKIAPMVGGSLPESEQFFAVRCVEISAGGIAFILDESPDFRYVVVSLDTGVSRGHFTALVVRTTPFEEGGVTRYRVGCKFIGRVRM